MARSQRGHGNRKFPPRPDFAQLEIFLKVSETRNFAEAARRLGVSQPAVSQAIAKLEDLYGGDLFERRRGAPVTLTPIGHAILPKAKLLLFTVDHQIERAVATAQSTSGRLTVGFYPGLGSGPLSSGIAQFRQTCPDVRLRFVEGAQSELYRQLNERSIDVMISALLPELAGGGNEQERLWAEPLVVALPDNHPLAGNESLRWSDLSSTPIVLRSHQGDLTAHRVIAARMGDQPFECELHDVSRGTIIEIVRLGFGVTISFKSSAEPREGVTFLPIVDDNATAWVEAIWPREDRNPLRHRLLSCIREQALRT